MTIEFGSLGGGGAGHTGNEVHHYYRQALIPTGSDPLQVGDLWSDTTANLLKRCTSTSPITFVSVEGGSAAHDLFSATHGDVDETDTPADNEVLTFNSTGSKWSAEPASGHGSHPTNHADLSSVTSDQHHAQAHAADHAENASDELLVEALGTAIAGSSFFRADGVGGVAGVTLTHAMVTGLGADNHHAQGHPADHADGGAQELAVQDLASDAATDGQVAKADGAGATAFEDDVAAIAFIIDGGGSAITTGVKGFIEIPFACVIVQQTTLADQSGSIVIDIWKDTYANYPPTVADTITASAKPTISTAVKDQDATLTGWTTTIAAGDILGFNVDSITTLQRVTIVLKVRKT